MEPPPPITFEEIRERAYELWERNHRPEGLEIRFWLLAERELKAERDRKLTGSVQSPAEDSTAKGPASAESSAQTIAAPKSAASETPVEKRARSTVSR
jgi:Protein of unknown function (DUF2934)